MTDGQIQLEEEKAAAGDGQALDAGKKPCVRPCPGQQLNGLKAQQLYPAGRQE